MNLLRHVSVCKNTLLLPLLTLLLLLHTHHFHLEHLCDCVQISALGHNILGDGIDVDLHQVTLVHDEFLSCVQVLRTHVSSK